MKTLTRIGFVLLLVALAGASFVGSLAFLNSRERPEAWPRDITATRIPPPESPTSLTIAPQPKGGRALWSFSLLAPAIVTIETTSALTVVHKAAMSAAPQPVPNSQMSSWLLPMGQYLVEAPSEAAPQTLKISVSPWPYAATKSQPLDAPSFEAAGFVDVFLGNFDKQAELFRDFARRRPEATTGSKSLTAPLIEDKAITPAFAAAAGRSSADQMGLAMFTVGDPSWIWFQIANVPSLACQLMVSHARAKGRPKLLAYMYVNVHDSTRNIIPLKEEDVDPERLCDKPRNMVTTGVKWLQ